MRKKAIPMAARLGLAVAMGAWVACCGGTGGNDTDGDAAQEPVPDPDAQEQALDIPIDDAAAEEAVQEIDDLSIEADVTGDVDGDAGDGASPCSGLNGFCDHYKDCGGTWYTTAQDCIDASLDYWGDCRRPQLDAFGDCMCTVSCADWGDPDVYNPNDTPCADEWSAVESAPGCD
jgi:hypothetical protein